MVSSKQKSNGIQILRAVLFIGILAFHAELPCSQILWGGVEGFFVISAYFLTKKLSKISAQEIKVIPQIKHRLTRLFPVYLLLLVGVAGIVMVIKRSLPIADFVWHVFFSQNINWMIVGYSSDLQPLTAHTWTLSIEVFLFVIWLVAFKCIKSNNKRRLFNIVAVLIAFVYRIVTVVVTGVPMVTTLCPISHMDAYALGSLLALREDDEDIYHQKYKYVFVVLGLIVIMSCVFVTAFCNNCSLTGAYCLYNTASGYMNNPYTCNIYIGFSLLSVGLIALFKDIVINRLMMPVVAVGNVSYSAYLIHFPINQLLMKITDNGWVVFGVTFVVSVVAAWIVEKVISVVIMERALTKL